MLSALRRLPICRGYLFLLKWLGIYQRAFFCFLNAFDDDAGAGLKAFFDYPFGADAVTHHDRCDMGFILIINHGDLIRALQFTDRALWEGKGAFSDLGAGADASELAWPEDGFGIWEQAGNLNRTRGGIYLAAGKGEFALFGVDRAVGEDQFKLQFLLVSRSCGEVGVLMAIVKISLLADDEIDFDGIDRGNRGQERPGWANKVADLSESRSR